MQKILIVTPLDETNVFASAEIFKKISPVCDVFSVPMYADYLLTTKIASSEEEAITLALSTVKKYMESPHKEDVVVLGNAPKDIKFDAVISFNKNERMEFEEDLRLLAMQKRYKSSEEISQILNNVYAAADCESFLMNGQLTAQFICDYLNKLKEIKPNGRA